MQARVVMHGVLLHCISTNLLLTRLRSPTTFTSSGGGSVTLSLSATDPHDVIVGLNGDILSSFNAEATGSSTAGSDRLASGLSDASFVNLRFFATGLTGETVTAESDNFRFRQCTLRGGLVMSCALMISASSL